MPLPDFQDSGDLPPGLHPATIEEAVARFGAGSLQRRTVTGNLHRIYQLARATGMLVRFVVFGSYVSDELEPNDVDVFLVMAEDFDWEQCADETQAVFVHSRADSELGASVFWVKAGAVPNTGISRFLEQWQTKRDQTRRGIVEVVV